MRNITGKHKFVCECEEFVEIPFIDLNIKHIKDKQIKKRDKKDLKSNPNLDAHLLYKTLKLRKKKQNPLL